MKSKTKYLPEFYPWRSELLDFTLKRLCRDLPILKIDVGSECNAYCKHCPSNCRGQVVRSQCDLSAIEALMKEISFRYKYLPEGSGLQAQGFICGVGEPTTATNRDILDALLKLSRKYDFHFAIRSNLISWDEHLTLALKQGNLSLMANLICLDWRRLQQLMGICDTKVSLILKHYEKLVTNPENADVTNVAVLLTASLSNLYYMREVIEKTIKAKVPLAVQESHAVRGKDDLYCRVGNGELNAFLSWLADEHNLEYHPPVCPAIFGAITVHDGYVVVDKETGLSCTRCFLEERPWQQICRVGELPYKQIVQRILEYREKCLPEVREMSRSYQQDAILSGCGGHLSEIFAIYLRAYDVV